MCESSLKTVLPQVFLTVILGYTQPNAVPHNLIYIFLNSMVLTSAPGELIWCLFLYECAYSPRSGWGLFSSFSSVINPGKLCFSL
jgi:hypothetical protein